MRITCALLSAALLAALFQPLAAATLDDQFSFVSPRPGADLVSKETTLIFKPRGESVVPPDLSVTGSLSGEVSGRWIRSTDTRTLIFKPDRSFRPGERVSVIVGGEVSYDFRVSKMTRPQTDFVHDTDCCGFSAPPETVFDPDAFESPTAIQTAFSFPSDFLGLNLIVNNNPTQGQIFLCGGNYTAILEKDLEPVYLGFQERRVTNFQKQTNGLLTFFLRGQPGVPHQLMVMDDTYSIIDEYAAENGYNMDFHEFLFLPNGHAVIMIYDYQNIDMSQVVPGGDPDALVVGLVLQEQDKSHNVVWEWRSWDHIPITDTTPDIDLTGGRVDYIHGNAMEIDFDGNMLISSRNLDEITKIEYQNGTGTGNVIWRLGGKQGQSDFVMQPDGEWFSHQHDIRRLPNGNITLFDNGNLNTPQESRPVEYALDLNQMTVTQVWENRHDPPLFGRVIGLHRRLPSGNSFVSWGNSRTVSEVQIDGTIEWELQLIGGFSYRVYHDSWTTGVAALPTLWADVDDAAQTATLHFYKWGDTDVAEYVVYTGEAPEPTTEVGTSTTNTFELTGLQFDTVYHVRVTGRDGTMNESGYSNEIQIELDPSVPVAINAFTAAATESGVELAWAIESDEELLGFRLYRRGGAGPEAALGGDDVIVADLRRYTDETARAGRTYAYTLAVVRADGTELRSRTEEVTRGAGRLALHANHPNPFNPSTAISYVLPEMGAVELSVYDVRGALVKTLASGVVPAGYNEVVWDGRDNSGRPVGSGVYFYKLTAGNRTLKRKMVLLK